MLLSRSHRLACLAIVAVVGVLLPMVTGTSTSSALPEGSVRSEGGRRARTIAPGVTYQRVKLRGPVVVHVVRIDPAEPSSIDAAAGGRRMGQFSRPSEIGLAHRALVAINGDFGLFRGMPLHAFQVDGELLARGIQLGTSFAMSQDEASSFLDTTRLLIDGSQPVATSTFDVAGWNSTPPGPGKIAAFTRYGGDIRPPPLGGCAVRLAPDSGATWDAGGVGRTRRYVVDVNRCRPKRMRVDPRTVVLASRRWGAGSKALALMAPGHRVRLSWSFGWPYVADSVAGVPRLVDDGSVVAPTCGTSFCRRHPRTGIGVADDGTILFIVADGRSRASVGMTLTRFARTIASFGAVQAVNLDGGGSSALWIAGRGIVNRPSDPGGERAVVNALLLLPGSDPGERTPGASHPITIRGGAMSDDAVALASRDPGSTGGLAEAWVDGSLIDVPPPPLIVRIADRFERTR